MLTEITPSSESITAVLTSHMATGECFDGAIIIGVYPGSNDEIWIQVHGQRVNVQITDVEPLCKQLRRARRIASEQEVPE